MGRIYGLTFYQAHDADEASTVVCASSGQDTNVLISVWTYKRCGVTQTESGAMDFVQFILQVLLKILVGLFLAQAIWRGMKASQRVNFFELLLTPSQVTEFGLELHQRLFSVPDVVIGTWESGRNLLTRIPNRQEAVTPKGEIELLREIMRKLMEVEIQEPMHEETNFILVGK